MALAVRFKKSHAIWAGAGLVIVAVAAAILWPTAPTSPWKPTTVPRTAECGAGCRDLGEIDTGGGLKLRLTEQPAVNDAVAQWADCLTSIRTCYEKEGRDAIRSCVSRSSCPATCRAEFARRVDAKTDIAGVVAAYHSTFLADDAPCFPPLEPRRSTGDTK